MIKNNYVGYICSRNDFSLYKIYYVSDLPSKPFPSAKKNGDYGYENDK